MVGVRGVRTTQLVVVEGRDDGMDGGWRTRVVVKKRWDGREAAKEEGILKLAERFLSRKVRAPHHQCPTFVCRLDNDTVTAKEGYEGD